MYGIALAMGLSCSAGCGSVSTPFLTAYVLGKGKNLKSSMKATVLFSMGKIIIMGILGFLTSYLSRELISKGITLLGVDITAIFSIFTLLVGLYLIYTFFKPKKCSGCKGSSKHKETISLDMNERVNIETNEDITKKEAIMLFSAGAAYGITPCLPLITMLGTALTLAPIEATLLLLFFGTVTCVTPAIIQSVVAGIVAPRAKKDLASKFRYITALAGIILCISSGASLLY